MVLVIAVRSNYRRKKPASMDGLKNGGRYTTPLYKNINSILFLTAQQNSAPTKKPPKEIGGKLLLRFKRKTAINPITYRRFSILYKKKKLIRYFIKI